MISTCSYSELNWCTACEEIIKHDSSIKRITSYRSFSQKQQIHTCLSAAAWYVFSSVWQCFVLEHLICDVLVDQIPSNFILYDIHVAHLTITDIIQGFTKWGRNCRRTCRGIFRLFYLTIHDHMAF